MRGRFVGKPLQLPTHLCWGKGTNTWIDLVATSPSLVTRIANYIQDYLRANSLFHTSLQKGKRATWHRLCTKTSSAGYWTMFWQLFQKRGQIQIEDFMKGDTVISMDEKKDQVLTTIFLFPPTSNEPNTRGH